jgi:hypothetical protein
MPCKATAHQVRSVQEAYEKGHPAAKQAASWTLNVTTRVACSHLQLNSCDPTAAMHVVLPLRLRTCNWYSRIGASIARPVQCAMGTVWDGSTFPPLDYKSTLERNVSLGNAPYLHNKLMLSTELLLQIDTANSTSS